MVTTGRADRRPPGTELPELTQFPGANPIGMATTRPGSDPVAMLAERRVRILPRKTRAGTPQASQPWIPGRPHAPGDSGVRGRRSRTTDLPDQGDPRTCRSIGIPRRQQRGPATPARDRVALRLGPDSATSRHRPATTALATNTCRGIQGTFPGSSGSPLSDA